MEISPSRQLVIALAGALAAGPLTQHTRKAWGTEATLMVMARAAVLTAQHRVVTNPSCGKRKRRQSEKGRGDKRSLINRSVADRTSTNRFTGHKLPLLVLSTWLCPESTADTFERGQPRTLPYAL